MKGILRRQEGFTLIELMVVVLIIGILVAIAIPVFQSTQNNAKRRTCFANERTMEGGIQQYNAEAVEFGSPLAALSDLLSTYVTVDGSGNTITFGPWLKAYPRCPSGGVYSLAGGNTVNCSIHGHF